MIRFELMPVLQLMRGIYGMPISGERFKHYLEILQGGNPGDLVVPIGGFNPMAKEFAVSKLEELASLDIEQLIEQSIKEIDDPHKDDSSSIFRIAFNMSDDLKGGWTNRFTSDYDSRFKMSALMRRKFCIPVFWTGENYSRELIIERTKEYCYRTFYWSKYSKPVSLQQHIKQESWVAKYVARSESILAVDSAVNDFYETFKTSTDYSTIFNFLYGDDAVIALGNTPLGIKAPFAGLNFATSHR